MHDYPCSQADEAMYDADRRKARRYAARQQAKATIDGRSGRDPGKVARGGVMMDTQERRGEMEWIDGDYQLGDIGFVIRRSNPIRHTESVFLASRPAYTNQSHQPRLYGWCGSWNDTNTYAEGIGRVTRVARNGRCQIVTVTEREVITGYVARKGYPELIKQLDRAQEKTA